MNIRIITASAGSGKTTRLSQVLDEAIASGNVRPDGIVATTFTREAAAELIERARSRLLASGRAREAQKLLASRIGTVSSVCGALVGEFAFELGLSPALQVLDESAAELEQKRALASVVGPGLADELQSYQRRFEQSFDWTLAVRTIIEAARANGLGASDLAISAERSVAALESCLPPPELDGDAIDAALAGAIDHALRHIDRAVDATKTTAAYVALLCEARGDLVGQRLRWGDWAKLAKEMPGKRSTAAVAPVAAAALRHACHPRLRQNLRHLIQLLFGVAAAGLAAYAGHKRERGLVDFVDQEALALRLLRRPDVRAALRGQLDLVLIDELQDTSPLQLAIFLELAALARESVWVGDQKQAIYAFRGTDPALMDAVIESLTATSTDPDLLHAAVETLGRESRVETLAISYRSRPALVELTNDLFAGAFARQGIPEERTRLSPADPTEPAGLGPVLEHWPLVCPARANKKDLAASVAAGMRELLAGGTPVRDRLTGAPRPAAAGDAAVLCRTNEQCQLVAEALAELGVPAVVPRLRVLDTMEGQVVLAGLRLWVDPGDALAAAALARLVSHATDLDGLVARALAAPGRQAFAGDPLVVAILGARAAAPDLDPVAALVKVVDASGLRELAAAWGNTAQRHANLDALRGHAVTYVRKSQAAGDAPTLVGLLRALEELAAEWGPGSARSDRQALLAGDDAVTVSTWHRAKGREWPLTVLFGLETLREPAASGLHVESDAPSFDVAEPLAGRWLRYWPNPYTTANQGGPVKDAFESSAAYAAVVARGEREAARLLYVGWTRARDRIILAAQKDKLTCGLFRTLVAIDRSLFSEPPGETAGERQVQLAGRKVAVRVRPASPAPPVVRTPEPGRITVGRSPTPYPARRLSPSAAPPTPCTLGAPVVLGPRLTLRGSPDMERVGMAVHGFLAADRLELREDERVAMAAGLLCRFGVDAHLEAPDVVAAGTRLWRWIDEALQPIRVHREWPVTEWLASGTLVAGSADLVVRSRSGLAVIDHKTFPGTLAAALERLPGHSGQLATYAHAIAAALGRSAMTTWIHLPLLGAIVELS